MIREDSAQETLQLIPIMPLLGEFFTSLSLAKYLNFARQTTTVQIKVLDQHSNDVVVRGFSPFESKVTYTYLEP